MGTRSVLSSDGRHRETLGQYGRHSTIWDPPLAPLAPRCKSELAAWSLEPFARHTQTKPARREQTNTQAVFVRVQPDDQNPLTHPPVKLERVGAGAARGCGGNPAGRRSPERPDLAIVPSTYRECHIQVIPNCYANSAVGVEPAVRDDNCYCTLQWPRDPLDPLLALAV